MELAKISVMATPKGMNPKVTFDLLNERYRLQYQMRSYQPGAYTRYQIIDKDNNPVTEYLLASQMRYFLKGLGKALEQMDVIVYDKTTNTETYRLHADRGGRNGL